MQVEELERQLAKLQIAKKDAESAEKLAQARHSLHASRGSVGAVLSSHGFLEGSVMELGLTGVQR